MKCNTKIILYNIYKKITFKLRFCYIINVYIYARNI